MLKPPSLQLYMVDIALWQSNTIPRLRRHSTPLAHRPFGAASLRFASPQPSFRRASARLGRPSEERLRRSLAALDAWAGRREGKGE